MPFGIQNALAPFLLAVIAAAALRPVTVVGGQQPIDSPAVAVPPDAGVLVAEVRGLLAGGAFADAERRVRAVSSGAGWTPGALEALSWLGRENLKTNRLDEAARFASETEGLALAALKSRALDDEPRLPTALGAAIEVRAHVLSRQGRLSEAVRLLEKNLETHGGTSIRTRLRKNLNLLSLEGQPAPEYEVAEFLGARPVSLKELKGKVVLLYFWAHWCTDCKFMAPVLAELQAAYRDKGLVIVAPTKRFGYVADSAPAAPAAETAYMSEVLKKFYGSVDMQVPVSAESFANYGSSSTPTVVLVDREGIVRLYHPGRMEKSVIEPRVRALVEGRQP